MSEYILTAPPPPADLRRPYGSHPLQFGDLRLPAGRGPYATVAVLHGGFWRARYDLSHIGHLCAALTAEGYATWNIEYRRVGNGGGWPHTFLDVGAGIDYLRDGAHEWNLDLTRLVTLGHSAGGHLALWVAGRGRIPITSLLWSPDPLYPAGAISLAGVVDLAHSHALGLGSGITERFLGGTPESAPDRYLAASPAALLPLGARQALVHGTEDDTVPISVSEQYTQGANAFGDDATLTRLPGMGHFEVIDPESDAWPSVLQAVRSMMSPAM